MDDDALFDLRPEDFTAARNDLAKRLRAAGERERAREVGELRRPTETAWAVNQVARRDAALLTAVRDTGDALIREQRRALSGVERADLRGVTAQRRAAVDAAAAAAEGHLAAAGVDPATHRDRIRATFEAASADPSAGEQVAAGRLSRELPPPSGLGALDGLRLVASGERPTQGAAGVGSPDAHAAPNPEDEPSKGGAGPAARSPEAAAASRAAATAATAATARARADEAEERAAHARADEERARIRAAAAEEAETRAEEELRRARERVAAAAAAVDDAVRAAEEATEAASAAAEEADDLGEDARRAAARAAAAGQT
jgi:hypothetical protein